MKNLILATALLASLTTMAAYAGPSIPRTVSVQPLNGGFLAIGGVLAANNSSDTVESIGCNMASYSNGATTFIQCFATASSGARAVCTRNTPAADAKILVSAVNAASRVTFTSDAAGNCTSVEVNNDSTNLF